MAEPAAQPAPKSSPEPGIVEVAIVTGLSGAGRTTAIRALEDSGWETVDNLPLSLAPRLIDPQDGALRLAIGVDSRTRGFSAEGLAELVAKLRALPHVAPTVIFLDCADEALLTRFGETRRRHPSAPNESADIGIQRERAALAAVRERADLVIDTTGLSPHALKARVTEVFAESEAAGLAVSIQSFAFKRGAPREAEMVFDVRFLRNPHWCDALRPLDGRDSRVDAYVAADPLFAAFFEKLADMALLLLPAYKREGKAYLGIGLGCTGGRHRSVAVAERLARRLNAEGWRSTVRHRELDSAGGS
jgi:UPF0042 nucleotide-binding protein